GGTRHFSGHSTFSFGRSVIEPNPTDRTNPAVPGGDSPLTPTTGGKYISEAADFDKLNISKSGKPENEVLTGSEITRGAVSHMLKADANDNSQLDRPEWTSIASQFGLNQDEAARAYSKANQDGQDGLSLSEMNRLAEQSITPEIMTADKSKDGKLSRAEFQSLVQDGPQKPGDKPPSIPEQTTDRILENLQRELEQLQQKLTELLEWLKNLLEQQPGPKPNPDVPTPKPFPDVPTPTPDVPAPTPNVPDIPGIPDLPIPQDIHDMAFVRQEFTDGNGSEGNDYRAPKNLEKVLINGNMMSYAEAYKEGTLYGQAPSAPIKPSFPDNIWDTAPTWDGEMY
ncbi:MAG TPA: hypothetical protein PK671_24625, partial [Candidatus Obscuribacter sp.]|nr:hypothetical protein [Candidatus Obscuribacter sp.]